jgi:hypothetical protein
MADWKTKGKIVVSTLWESKCQGIKETDRLILTRDTDLQDENGKLANRGLQRGIFTSKTLSINLLWTTTIAYIRS